MDKQQWLNYINKKIDQELNVRKYSGLTSWALIGTIIALSSSAFNDFSLYGDLKVFSDWVLLIIVISLNTLFLSIILFNNIPKINLDSNEVKTNSRYDNSVEIDLLITNFVLLIVIAFLNYLAVIQFKYQLNLVPYIIITIFVLLQSIFVIYLIKTRYSCIKKGTDLPLIIDIFSQENQGKFMRILNVFMVTAMVYLIYSLLHSFRFNGSDEELFVIIKFTGKIIGISILFMVLKIYSYKDLRINKLRAFEQSILLNKIKMEDIEKQFIERFVSVSLNDWIISKQKLVSEIHERYDYLDELVLKGVCNKECEQCPFDASIDGFEMSIGDISNVIDQVEYIIMNRLVFRQYREKLDDLLNELTELSKTINEKLYLLKCKVNSSKDSSSE